MATCLIVDDSTTVRKVLRHMIGGLGFDLAEAADGEAALEYCRASLPRFIMLDWNMPKMDGLAFLRALRKLPGGDAPVVIFCTTVNDLPQIERAIIAGADEYIMKPFDVDILRAKLSQTGLL